LGRIVAVSAREPLAGWTGIVPEGAGPLEHAAFFGGWVVTSTIEDARSVVRRYSAEGRPAGEVALPGAGHVEGFFGPSGPTGYFVYTDYLTPPAIYKLDVARGQTQLVHAPGGIDTAAYVTDRLFVPGQDGTRVPLYVTHRRDRQRDGDQPLILQASGLLAPSFSPEVLTWLELGGAYAQVSVRPERRAATVQSRQSGLDDLQQAADYLVRERYTRTRRLGLYGRGSSALAVAAAMSLRPQGYGAMVAQLTSERGDETRASLDTYAPYRRVHKGLCYPPTLVTTLDRDSRVAPWEGYKLIASMQAVQLCSNPVLLRVDPRAEGPARHAEVSAEQWAFLAQWLGLEAAS
jgi:prolyl oligopeptidase